MILLFKLAIMHFLKLLIRLVSLFMETGIPFYGKWDSHYSYFFLNVKEIFSLPKQHNLYSYKMTPFWLPNFAYNNSRGFL